MHEAAKFVLSKRIVQQQLDSLKPYADRISYSIKTNYEVGKVLEWMSDCSFSVHSIEEAKLINKPNRLWYFAQALDKQDIQLLLKIGVKNFVVDNHNDLKILLENVDGNINLLLRMRLREHTVHTGKHFVYGFYSKDVNELIAQLKHNKMIDKLGIHFHRKTQNVSEWNLKNELMQSISNETLKDIDLVNIGGGLPSVYKNFRPDVLPLIFEKILDLRRWLNSNDIEMIIEPGRYI
ncbi:decarboxylase, partial [Candidatus Woesearchaeota archaeon]|nr:decarboxylase [Candidatus Woesearchaeota archaeon]